MFKYLQCILCYFFVCGTVVAQPTFTISSVEAAPGEVFSLQVSAVNMVAIVSMQYSLAWDPNVLTFQQVKDFGIPGLGAGNFGAQNAGQGSLTASWVDFSLEGVTESAVDMFKLEFKAGEGIGQVESAVSFSESPLIIEVSDSTGTVVEMIPVNGVVNVLDPNDIEEEINTGIKIGQIAPNPFINDAFIPVEITESNNIKIEIITLTGAQIYEHTELIHPGLHKINIPGDIFPANGTYLCSLLIGEKKVAKKLFYNGK